ncbi:hypothetical protein M404DRAFT_518431 [Pisolithus tinctorius Marx 270]|uniref:Methionyl-tRNA synthetase n=1 Tax=Pisolithus tinctorius Marx 270 TaxID=870435 RepID=A0A0C3K6Q2_PISTI|nr:hypothetical protein M404DRAFT_518431 [Pisolithus tinctorius Marx 270]
MLRCAIHLSRGGCLSSVVLPRHPRAPRLRRCNATSSTTEKPFYITTPIFYPNARPHIGHLYSLVTADIIARYQRILNPTRPVVFLTGTDEHGLKMQQTALAKGVDPLEWCDTISSEFHKGRMSAVQSSCVRLGNPISRRSGMCGVRSSLEASYTKIPMRDIIPRPTNASIPLLVSPHTLPLRIP